MRIDTYNYFTIDLTKEEESLLRMACKFYCESMEGNMTGEDDLIEETYEAVEHLHPFQNIYYCDLECYHNALSYWLDANDEDPNADPTAYWQKREAVDKLDEEICKVLL